MSDRIVVRSSTNNRILFNVFKAYYPTEGSGKRTYIEHRHTELELSTISSGSGIYNCNGRDYPFAAGDVFLHCGNDAHYIKDISADEPLSLVIMRFEPRFIWSPGGEWFDSKYLKLFTQSSPTQCVIPHTAEAAGIISNLLEESFFECRDQNPAYELLIKAKLLTILANIARFFHQEMANDRTPLASAQHLSQMEQSMDYILDHLEEHLTLELLAKEACISRAYYSTVFKTLNGISPWEYITIQRIDRAKNLLEGTDIAVTQVSENCGFNSIANFNRAFKKITGKSPREYRNAAYSLEPSEDPRVEGAL